ncbi:hypothetical protein GLOTRDRAFT_94760 [Gloeophyllum trabeum ATCC 11539]|uniref:DUF6533 domain-containing protein n=1 Tax=Gloeophyllum trabeum (strain ATCC 11539 / FP-39264 / Madison 617) TaxID=670483 RepID=S7RH33_GLOTA|nr:uncharacterized protein GLOTRDRAFT_94760 [Gloeophyllum trabeum ATCC 11539]EPQ53535.1 hypothetical protein GLOTRDRAFT_94760 [Gloeophyllum trabeum ATCC 11539]
MVVEGAYVLETIQLRDFMARVRMRRSLEPHSIVAAANNVTVLLFYDHVLTFDSEVSFIWQSSARVGKTLFLLNRYFALASNISYIVMLHAGVSLSSWFTVAAHTRDSTEAIRTCLVRLMGGRAVTDPFYFDAITRDLGLASAWEALLAFDIFIFAMVVLKVLKEYHEDGMKGLAGDSLVKSILRDASSQTPPHEGAAYFVFMTAANLANIVTYHPSWVGFLASPAANVSVLAMSRLMLHLHEVAKSRQVFELSRGAASVGLEFEWHRDPASSGVGPGLGDV